LSVATHDHHAQEVVRRDRSSIAANVRLNLLVELVEGVFKTD
jgi:hypothetical protein